MVEQSQESSAPQLPVRVFEVTLGDGKIESVSAHVYALGDHGAVTFCDHQMVNGQMVLFFRDTFARGEWRRVREVSSHQGGGARH